MGVDHAWEKFHSAIRFALVSSGSPQERLSCLISGIWDLQRDSFPDEHVWDDFRKLINGAARKGISPQTEARIQSTDSQMSDEQAREYLKEAFEIFSDIAKAFGRTEFVI
jgi:hypothetical protein